MKLGWARGQTERRKMHKKVADKRNRGRAPTRWTDDLKRIVNNWIREQKSEKAKKDRNEA